MRSVNKVTLIGNLGRDPEVKYTPKGTACAQLSIATNEEWKDKDGNKQTKTEWHRVILWARLAEIAGEYLKKGGMVYIEGKLQTRSWEQDGQTRYATEIVGREMLMLSGNGEKPIKQGSGKKQDDPTAATEITDEDIPF